MDNKLYWGTIGFVFYAFVSAYVLYLQMDQWDKMSTIVWLMMSAFVILFFLANLLNQSRRGPGNWS